MPDPSTAITTATVGPTFRHRQATDAGDVLSYSLDVSRDDDRRHDWPDFMDPGAAELASPCGRLTSAACSPQSFA
jgi:hypothetical protein